MAPRSMAPYGLTTPAAGVMATSPAKMPETNPSEVALRKTMASMMIHVSAPLAADICVMVNARAVSSPLCTVEPALKPNQPTQRSPAPISVMTRLFGFIAVFGYPYRGPSINATIRALKPAETWITRPPARSITPEAPALKSHPSGPRPNGIKDSRQIKTIT